MHKNGIGYIYTSSYNSQSVYQEKRQNVQALLSATYTNEIWDGKNVYWKNLIQLTTSHKKDRVHDLHKIYEKVIAQSNRANIEMFAFFLPSSKYTSNLLSSVRQQQYDQYRVHRHLGLTWAPCCYCHLLASPTVWGPQAFHSWEWQCSSLPHRHWQISQGNGW